MLGSQEGARAWCSRLCPSARRRGHRLGRESRPRRSEAWRSGPGAHLPAGEGLSKGHEQECPKEEALGPVGTNPSPLAVTREGLSPPEPWCVWPWDPVWMVPVWLGAVWLGWPGVGHRVAGEVDSQPKHPH